MVLLLITDEVPKVPIHIMVTEFANIRGRAGCAESDIVLLLIVTVPSLPPAYMPYILDKLGLPPLAALFS